MNAVPTEIMEAIVELNIAAAVAILFLLALRKPARHIFGPHAVYLLWAIVPIAAAATFIPARTVETLSLGMTLEEIIALAAPPAAASLWETVLPYALAVAWIVGAIVTAAALVSRQAAFLHDADLGLAGPPLSASHTRASSPRMISSNASPRLSASSSLHTSRFT